MNEELKQSLRNWVKLDNEIRQLKSEEQKRKNDQKKISQQLMELMKEQEIDEFNLKDGKLVYSKKNVKKSITKKMLLTTLSKYFKEDINKALEVNAFILDSREEHEVENLKFQPNKETH